MATIFQFTLTFVVLSGCFGALFAIAWALAGEPDAHTLYDGFMVFLASGGIIFMVTALVAGAIGAIGAIW
jgi:hypothetical protein